MPMSLLLAVAWPWRRQDWYIPMKLLLSSTIEARRNKLIVIIVKTTDNAREGNQIAAAAI